jgi:hypothetical protein
MPGIDRQQRKKAGSELFIILASLALVGKQGKARAWAPWWLTGGRAGESPRDVGRSGCRGELLQGHRVSVAGLDVDVVEETTG